MNMKIYQLRVTLDKLTLALPIQNLEKSNRKIILENLEDIVAAYDGIPLTKKGKGYRHRYRIPINESCALVIEYRPNRPEKAVYAIRFEWNPNKAGIAGNSKIKQILYELFGEDANRLVSHLVLIAVDWCIDVPGISIRDVIILVAEKQYCSTWGKVFHDGADLESLMLGSPRSDHQVRCYDKPRQILSALAQSKTHIKMFDRKQAGEELVSALEQTSEEMGKLMRIEVSTKYRALHPSQLHEVDNPFEGIKIYGLPQVGEALDSDMGRLFIDSIQLNGMNAALRRIQDVNQRRRFRREVVKHAQDWWNPTLFKEQLVEAVKVLDMYPESAFLSDALNVSVPDPTNKTNKADKENSAGSLSKMRPLRKR